MTAEDLKRAGFPLPQLKDAGLRLGALVDAGFDIEQVMLCNFPRQQIAVQFDAPELKRVGYDACELRNAGFTLSQLRRAGYLVSQLLCAGFLKHDVLTAGFFSWELQDAGITAEELSSVGIRQPMRMLHGTSEHAAKHIMKMGFVASVDGMLGRGVYLTPDIHKARAYGRVIVHVVVDLGYVLPIKYKGHPLQASWKQAGYDSARVPPRCGVVDSGLEEYCVYDPRRVKAVATYYI